MMAEGSPTTRLFCGASGSAGDCVVLFCILREGRRTTGIFWGASGSARDRVVLSFLLMTARRGDWLDDCLVAWLLAWTKGDQRSSEYQYLRVPVVSAFGTRGTDELLSCFSSWYSRHPRVPSHSGVWYSRYSLILESFQLLVRQGLSHSIRLLLASHSLSTNDWYWYSDDL